MTYVDRRYAASLKKREALWTVPKPAVPKTTGIPVSPRPSTPSSVPSTVDKTRTNLVPSGSTPTTTTVNDARRATGTSATPSAPRAQLASTNGTPQMVSDRPSDTRIAMGRQVYIIYPEVSPKFIFISIQYSETRSRQEGPARQEQPITSAGCRIFIQIRCHGR